MHRRVVILGGPGSGVIFTDVVRALAAVGEPVELLGFLNDVIPVGETLAGAPVLGRFEDWARCPDDARFISAIPNPKQSWARFRRILALGIPPERWTSLVHPRAEVAPGVSIGSGSYVGPFAIVEAGAVLGCHVCLRGGAYLSHDVALDDFVFIGPNASVLGRSRLGEGVHIGANATCREEIAVGRYAVVGTGAAVIADVAEFLVVAGVPARTIGQVTRRLRSGAA